MSEDNSHPTAETETDEKGQQVNRPLHRRLTNDQFGGGVLIIVLIEIIVGAIGHWNSPEVKFILTVGILWLSYWLYAELRYRKRASRAKAGSLAVLLGVAAACIAGLAYASLGNQQLSKQSVDLTQAAPTLAQLASLPPTTPASSVSKLPTPTASPFALVAPAPLAGVATYSQISPIEICDQVKKALPFQQDGVEKGFVGTPVRWKLWLSGVTNINGRIYAFFVASTERFVSPSISALIKESDIQYLKAAKENDRFDVAGTIEYVDPIHVGIQDARILPAN